MIRNPSITTTPKRRPTVTFYVATLHVKTVVFPGHYFVPIRTLFSVRIGTKQCPEDTFVFTVYVL